MAKKEKSIPITEKAKSPVKLDPSKRDLRIQKRALKKEAREHNKAARKTEGTRLQQFLRRKFGKNKPKESTPVKMDPIMAIKLAGAVKGLMKK